MPGGTGRADPQAPGGTGRADPQAPGGTGRYVALLGVDGIGKSTMADLLCQALSRGSGVKRVSWRAELDGAARPNTRRALQQLWVESLRLIHLGVDGPVPPPTYEEFARGGWERLLGRSTFSTNVPAGPLAAAWLEWVGQVLLRYEVILPQCARGVHVVDESFGLKVAFKELLIADRLADDPATTKEIERARTILTELFGACAPDVGILFTGPVEQAYRWRMRQKGSPGGLETMGAATGDRGEAGFIELQSQCDRFLRAFADRYGWIVFEMHDLPAEENFARLCERLEERSWVW